MDNVLNSLVTNVMKQGLKASLEDASKFDTKTVIDLFGAAFNAKSKGTINIKSTEDKGAKITITLTEEQIKLIFTEIIKHI